MKISHKNYKVKIIMINNFERKKNAIFLRTNFTNYCKPFVNILISRCFSTFSVSQVMQVGTINICIFFFFQQRHVITAIVGIGVRPTPSHMTCPKCGTSLQSRRLVQVQLIKIVIKFPDSPNLTQLGISLWHYWRNILQNVRNYQKFSGMPDQVYDSR